MNYPNYQPIVDYKVNYESLDVSDGSIGKVAGRIPTATVVSLILTDDSTVDEITQLIKQTRYFDISDFHPADILNKNFIDAFLKAGKLECFSIGHNPHQEICIERNVMHLKVSRDECHESSIEELIQFRVKEDEEFMKFKIELTAIPSKNDLAKLRDDMKKIIKPSKVLLAYSSSADISSLSVGKYLEDLSRNVTTLENKLQTTKEFNLKCPNIDDNDQTSLYDASEFFGMILLGQSLDDNDLHSMQSPPEAVDLGKGTSIMIRGFITPSISVEMLKILEKSLSESEQAPWLGLSLTGHNHKSKFVVLNKSGKMHLL